MGKCSLNILNVADMLLISLLFERSEYCTVSSSFVIGLLLHCILYFDEGDVTGLPGCGAEYRNVVLHP